MGDPRIVEDPLAGAEVIARGRSPVEIAVSPEGPNAGKVLVRLRATAHVYEMVLSPAEAVRFAGDIQEAAAFASTLAKGRM